MTESMLHPRQSPFLKPILYLSGLIALTIAALAGLYLGPMRGAEIHLIQTSFDIGLPHANPLITIYHVPAFLLTILCLSVITIVPCWRIFIKAGFPGALSLLIVIPIANLVLLYVLAFSKAKAAPAQNV